MDSPSSRKPLMMKSKIFLQYISALVLAKQCRSVMKFSTDSPLHWYSIWMFKDNYFVVFFVLFLSSLPIPNKANISLTLPPTVYMYWSVHVIRILQSLLKTQMLLVIYQIDRSILASDQETKGWIVLVMLLCYEANIHSVHIIYVWLNSLDYTTIKQSLTEFMHMHTTTIYTITSFIFLSYTYIAQ